MDLFGNHRRDMEIIQMRKDIDELRQEIDSLRRRIDSTNDSRRLLYKRLDDMDISISNIRTILKHVSSILSR